jgi:formiminoglutamase
VAFANIRTNTSITPGRCDLAPDAVREALWRLSTFDCETGLSLEGVGAVDRGDLPPEPSAWAEAVSGCRAGVVLGGDNLATRTAVLGLAELHGGLGSVGLVTLDAHLDMRHTQDGPNNGNVVRGLLESGLSGRNVLQVGLAPFANSRVYWQDAVAAGSTLVTVERARRQGLGEAIRLGLDALAQRVRAVHVDFDVDVLDRSLAPACPGARPGGILFWEAREAVLAAGRSPLVASIDFVEIDPEKDEGGRTALAAAHLAVAFAASVQCRE